MLLLIAAAIAVLFCAVCAPQLKKHPAVFYISAAVISAVMIVLSQQRIENAILQNYIIGLFSKGALAGALWCVVMVMGALPNGSKSIKHLMPVRGELSIFTAILTVSHIVTYGVIYIKRLLNPDFDPKKDFIATCIIALLLLCIMTPLTIMSIKKVRRKMDAKFWKKIQRFAYVFFALIYIHVMVIYIPRAKNGSSEYLFTVMLYTAVWASYLIFRIRKYLYKTKKIKSGAKTNLLSALGYAAVLTAVFLTSHTVNSDDEKISAANTMPVTSREIFVTKITETTAPLTENLISETKIPSSAVSEISAETEIITENITENTSHEDSLSETQNDIISETEPIEISSEIQSEIITENEEIKTTSETQTEAAEIQTAEETTVSETETVSGYVPSIYNNGEYTGKAYGYDGFIYVTVIIENDMIISVSSSCEEEDISYYLSCRDKVTEDILNTQSTDVDAVSEATYSSDAIKKAVSEALDSARIN